MNLETITQINAIFAIALGIAVLLLYWNKKKQPRRIAKDKEEPYTGGENIPDKDLQQSAEAVFWPLKKAFNAFYKTIGKRHTGNLSDYLSWILLALVLITLAVVGVLYI